MKDQTKVKVFNAENPESLVEDKVSYTMTFPNLTVNYGDPYTVCTVSVGNVVLNCVEGNNSPIGRPEFIDIDVSEEVIVKEIRRKVLVKKIEFFASIS